MQSRDALLIVDVQNDFCPGGALAVEGGDAVVPVLNDWARRAERAGALVVASCDWHPPDHCSFRQRGGPWPVHCVRSTRGARFHPDLRLPTGSLILRKGTQPDRDAYSAFDGTGLAERLRDRRTATLYVGGLAQDVCVRATVIDACRAGFDVVVLDEATRPVNVQPGDGERALHDMQEAGARILAAAAG